ncbi:MAG: SlyX family protein [Planctomycetota bacterium]|nr:SlyX family protein [Planctomycetota bacterium]
MEDRLIALEEKFGFLERQVEQLDDVIKELYGVVETLQRDLRAVKGYVEKVETRITEGTTQGDRPEPE